MSNDLSSKCRTCLGDSNFFHQLFDYVDENYKILEMLDSIVPQIDIKCNTQFSTLVCQSCVDRLLTGYKFQQFCIETNNRLHDLLGIAVFDTEPKLEKVFDPLKGESNLKMKQEADDDVCYERVKNPEEFELSLKSDNDNDLWVPASSDSDTDSSNEKLSVLKERSAKRSPLKEEDPETENYDAGKDLFTKPPNSTENIDVVNTGIGEVEKPKSSNKRSGHLSCEVCGKIFEHPYRLKRHSSVHSITKPHECEICKYRFATVNILKTHLVQHKNQTLTSQSLPEGFKCADCPRRFEKRVSLSAHRQIHTRNSTEAKFPCMVCERKFMTIKSLTEHITRIHPDVETYNCNICQKSFILHGHLEKHLNLHKVNKNEKSESPYLCPRCGKTYRNSSNLYVHMERHSGQRKYKCHECPSRFNCRTDLTKHTKIHTNAKPHVCDICDSRFTRKCSLKKHKLLHLGEKPFKCNQCSMTFLTIYHLKRHIQTHTGEKPYKCKYCERAYAASVDLTKHLRTHVGENTNICEQCPMAFKYKAELKYHQSEHYKPAQNISDDKINGNKNI